MATSSPDTTPTPKQLSEYYRQVALKVAMAKFFKGTAEYNIESATARQDQKTIPIEIETMDINGLSFFISGRQPKCVFVSTECFDDSDSSMSKSIARMDKRIRFRANPDIESIEVLELDSLPTPTDRKLICTANDGRRTVNLLVDSSSECFFVSDDERKRTYVLVQKDHWEKYLAAKNADSKNTFEDGEKVVDIEKTFAKCDEILGYKGQGPHPWVSQILSWYGHIFTNADQLARTALTLLPIDTAVGEVQTAYFLWGNIYSDNSGSGREVQIRIAEIGGSLEGVLVNGFTSYRVSNLGKRSYGPTLGKLFYSGSLNDVVLTTSSKELQEFIGLTKPNKSGGDMMRFQEVLLKGVAGATIKQISSYLGDAPRQEWTYFPGPAELLKVKS